MKNHIRYLMLLAALLLTSSAVWADELVTFNKTGLGEASYAVAEKNCVLIMTPASGYFVTVDNIKVTKTTAGGNAQSPRRVPDIAEPVEVKALSPDDDPTGITRYVFPLSEGEYTYEVTVDFQSAADNKLLLVCGKMVTEENRHDILNDGGSMKYDGKKQLVFEKLSLEDGGIQSWIGDLEVYLKDINTMTTSSVPAIEGHGGKLTFTTQGNEPGKLYVKMNASGAVLTGFDSFSFEQNLALLAGALDSNNAEIGTPVDPIVNESGETNTVNLDGGGAPGTDLSNTNINDVLYTLNSDNDDGIGEDGDGSQYVILASTMIEDDVDGIVGSYSPGTSDYAQNFDGLTFLVPAGYGKIYVKVRTGEHGVLKVKVGNTEPFVITGALDFTEYTFTYVCPIATYVYIYNDSPVETSEAPGHHAGKKTTVTIGVGSVGVTSNSVQSSNGDEGSGEGNDPIVLSDESVVYDDEAGTLVATNSAVNIIADDAFITFPFLKYIDLRGTSITGLKVSRSEGPFNGVSKNTFIYLPAGNSSDEPNVVVGDICEKVVLDGQMQKSADDDDESFGLSGSFMAQQVVFDYPFAPNKMAAVCLPFDIEYEDAEQYGTFYIFDGFKNGNVQLTPNSLTVEAHTPYAFLPATDAQLKALGVMMSMSADAAGAPRRASSILNDLYGTYEFLGYDPTDRDVFRLALNEYGDAKFERLKEGEFIRPFESYLYAVDEAADSFGVEGEGITGIVRPVRTVSPSLSDSWSALDGLRFKTMPTQKGVYIHNGQKVIIR